MNLGLGSVQFGLDYGIANATGRTPAPEVAAILALAAERGVKVLDTAPSYGDSEAVVGRALPADQDFRIISKTRYFRLAKIGREEVATLDSDFRASLERLGVERLYGLLLHHCDDLLAPGGERLWAAMAALKDRGLVAKIGVSVYTKRQIEAVLERFTIDLVQLPLNVLDQRLSREFLDSIKRAGIEIHARSTFLQGLLLMPLPEIPDYFAPIRPLMRDYRDAIAACGMTALQAALAYVRRQSAIDHVIVGVTRRAELTEILAAFEIPVLADFDFSPFAVDDERMVDPSRWQAT